MQTKFKFFIRVGRFKNAAMDFVIVANQQTVYQFVDKGQDTIDVEFVCDLPAEVSILVSGKQPMDTLIDESGRIIQDKFIQIERLCIDGLPIKQWILESRVFKFVSDDATVLNTNIFSYNGKGTMSLPYSSSFRFMLDLFRA